MNREQQKAINLLKKADAALAKAKLSIFVNGDLFVFDSANLPLYPNGGGINQQDYNFTAIIPKAYWDGGDF